MKNQTPVYIFVLLFLLAALVMSLLAAVTIGSVKISVSDVYNVILYKLFKLGDETKFASGAIHDVVWYIRLPRLILAIAVGIGLSICGVVMQAIVKNPLADPYVLGISSGASLGATLSIALGIGISLGNNYIGICAFIGAFLVSLIVMGISNIGSHSNSIKLLLAGMAVSSVCSAFSSFIVYFVNDKEKIKDITYWLMGSLAGASWSNLNFIFPFIIIGMIFFISQSRILNLMLLGDEVSITLGTDLHLYRQIYLFVSSIIIGLVVYSSGTIGFIGLIIPHLVRMIFGTDHKKVIPLASLLGAIFLIWADVLSRIIIQNTELPIGILTSIIGSPFFIYLMIKKTYGFGGNFNGD